jgi:hypothetical protein
MEGRQRNFAIAPRSAEMFEACLFKKRCSSIKYTQQPNLFDVIQHLK